MPRMKSPITYEERVAALNNKIKYVESEIEKENNHIKEIKNQIRKNKTAIKSYEKQLEELKMEQEEGEIRRIAKAILDSGKSIEDVITALKLEK